MKSVTVESGVCLGFGGTNARRAVCESGDIRGFVSVETPTKPREFFGWMARQALQAAHDGHSWLVAGYPGPVEDGRKIGPMANVPGLAKSQYVVAEEIAAADPAAGRLLEDGFVLVNTNDGGLAAQAAASRIGQNKFQRVAALIDGTGTGAGIVDKDPAYSNVYRVDASHPNEIGHILRSPDPRDTFENTISGTAIEVTYGDPRELPASHPAWRRVGEGIGMLATTLGIMNGANLVVVTGGLGAGASDKYGPHLDSMMDAYREYGNGPQKLFVPEIVPVPVEDAQVFELFGAEPVMADYYSRPA